MAGAGGWCLAGLLVLTGCGSVGADAVVTVTSTVAADGGAAADRGARWRGRGDRAVGGTVVVTASPVFGTADLAPQPTGDA